MSIDLNNKKILVTGSTDGLGKKLVFELAKLGVDVIVHGKDESKVSDTVNELQDIYKDKKYESVVCDLSDPKSIEAKFSEIKELDILINNAGIWQEGETDKLSSHRLIEVMNVNLTAPLVITKTLLNTLRNSEYAQILNVVSVAGVEIPTGYFHTIYSASKFGLQAFSEALEKEHDNKNIRVMGYYPGGMYTKLFKKAGIDYKDKEDWMFDPQESVDAIIFMLTRDPKVNIKRMDLINHLQK